MKKDTAEVMYWVVEFSAENGQWPNLCEWLESKGLSPIEISTAVNENAKAAGFTGGLTADDCR